jgi:naphthalene 1,2-dioxygenase ferredoxin reductase component
MYRLIIRQWPLPIAVKKQTLLDAALAAGVPYPHGCRTGECGSCKTRLLSGDVSMTAYDGAVLSQSERAEGLILVCRARPRSDVHIAWLGMDEDESLPIQRMMGQVTNVEVLTPDIRRIYVWPERPLQFAAGQYVRLGFGTLPFRSYSMANRPDEEVLEFHIRLVPSGVASRYVADHLKPGERIRLEGPAGSAHLRPDHDGPIVAVAGGTGLAPILSIVRTRLQTGSTQPIWLYVGARTSRDAYNETALGELTMRYPNLKVNIALSSGEPSSSYHAGLLHEVVARDISFIPEVKCYLAGPPAMIESARRKLLEAGFSETDIHADPFYGCADAAPQKSICAWVRSLFLQVGRTRWVKSLWDCRNFGSSALI